MKKTLATLAAAMVASIAMSQLPFVGKTYTYDLKGRDSCAMGYLELLHVGFPKKYGINGYIWALGGLDISEQKASAGIAAVINKGNYFFGPTWQSVSSHPSYFGLTAGVKF